MNEDRAKTTERNIWEQELTRRRHFERVQGGILVCIGGVGLLALVFPFVTSFPRMLSLGPWYAGIALLLILCFFYSCVLGIWTLRSASRPTTQQDVARVRQSERARLYQEAQGVLPWTYRSAGRISMVILGCIALVGGILVLFSFGVRSVDAWVMGAAGVVFLWLALYRIPRESRHLPEQSVQALSNEMIAGETSAKNSTDGE